MITLGMRDNTEIQKQEMMFETFKRQMHCAIPAIIQSYDNKRGTVTAAPALREIIYNDSDGIPYNIELPLLLDVPILFPCGGGYVLTFPVTAGDECLIIFGDMCIDAWWQNGGIQNQAEQRRHDLSDGFAILAPFSQSKIKDFSTFSNSIMELRNVDGTQKIQLSNTAVNLVGNVLKNGSPIGGGGGSSDWSDITNKPTTIAGYGITDAKIVSNTITLGTDSITVPTVNNATLTIQKNGTNVNTFTANASTDVTANITVPTTTSELTNNSGFITNPNIPYFTCSTASATAAKVATLVSGTFGASQLVTGAQILVKFSNANGVASPTLNANSTGAISIKRYSTTAPSTSAASSWNAGSVVCLIYDGTYWQMQGWVNTTYSGMTDAQVTAGTSTTNMLLTPARLKLGVQTHAPVQSVNGQTGAVTISTTTDIMTSVTASTWVSDSTYTGYDYKCEIDATGYDVDNTTFAEVTFDADDALSGDYAPVCTTGTDTITIYSKVNTSITIPSILIVRAS